MGIDWKAVEKRTLAVLPRIEKDVDAWLEKYDNWLVDINFVNYPPRFRLVVYRLSSVDSRRVETSVYSKKRKASFFIVQRLKDEELDELTELITPIVENYHLQCASKKVDGGVVVYTLWLKKEPEKITA